MSRRNKRQANPIDIPFGRVELLGQIVYLVQHDGHLITLGAGPPDGRPREILTARGNSESECRELMHRSVEMLFDLVSRAPLLCVQVADGSAPCNANGHAPFRPRFGAEPGNRG